MKFERITDAIKSVLSIGQSRLDSMVGDYRGLEKFSKILGKDVPVMPEDIAEVGRITGRLTEEEIQEYLERTQPQE